MSVELWRSVPIAALAESHEVSNHGRVRRLIASKNGHPPGILRPRKCHAGHLRFSIQQDGEKYEMFAHRLVLLAFEGPCPAGMEGCHNDGNPANNHIGNLRWDTPSNNNLDKRRHGTMPVGDRNGMRLHPDRAPRGDHSGRRTKPTSYAHLRGETHSAAKLTAAQVADIRSRFIARTTTKAALAREFCVNWTTIHRIVSGLRWKEA